MSEAKTPRPLPRVNVYMNTKPFWEAAREGKLLVQFCKDTNRPQFFPRPVSLATGRRNVEWREVSGRGKIYSWTVTYSAWPGHEDRAPYVCALVELDEGVRMLANLTHCRPEDIKIGMPVRVCWERLSEEIHYPGFEPA